MNDYTQYNDAKGRDARMRVEANRAERAKAQDFDGTLFMYKHEIVSRRTEAAFKFLFEHGVRS